MNICQELEGEAILLLSDSERVRYFRRSGMRISVSLWMLALYHLKPRIDEKSMVLADVENSIKDIEYTNIDAKAKAQELGRKEYANTILSGLIIEILKFDGNKLKNTIEEKFQKHASQENIKAFELADRFQIPAILLINQYLDEINTTVEDIDLRNFPQRRYIQKTTKDYKRYKITANGISPRGISLCGEGIVYTDSHEHDEEGHMSESYVQREKMIQKRKAKLDSLKKIALKPYVYHKGSIALVGWGSTKEAISEVIKIIKDKKVYQIHYFWLYPLPEESLRPLREAEKIIMIENNSDGQFTALLKQHGIKADQVILQSNGFAFFSDQLSEKVQMIL